MSIYELNVNGFKYIVELGDVSTSPVEVVVNGERKTVTFADVAAAPAAPAPQPTPTAAPEPTPAAPVVRVAPGEGQPVKAPMPGKVISIAVQVGAHIKEGDTLLTFEAMKMEMPLSSTITGTVKAIAVAVGDNVAYDDTLLYIG